MFHSSNLANVEPVTFILDPIEPREAQARLLRAFFALVLLSEPEEFEVHYDDARDRIHVLHCEHILTGRCSPVPHVWTMQIYSDDDGYRFWDTDARLIAFTPVG